MTTVEYEPAPATTIAGTALNWREWLKRLGPLIGLVFVMAVFSVLTPSTFLSTFNLRILLLQTAVVGTAALGMTLIIISGGIDLSVGSNVALSSVIIALLLNAGVNPVVAALGGIIGGLAVGILIGGLVTGLQLMPFIVTLGLMGALRGAAIMVAGQGGVVYPPPALRHSWIGSLLSLQPAINSISAGGGTVTIKWTSIISRQFKVQWADSLAAPIVWNTIDTPITSDTGFFQFTDDGSVTAPMGPRRFYRLVQAN